MSTDRDCARIIVADNVGINSKDVTKDQVQNSIDSVDLVKDSSGTREDSLPGAWVYQDRSARTVLISTLSTDLLTEDDFLEDLPDGAAEAFNCVKSKFSSIGHFTKLPAWISWLGLRYPWEMEADQDQRIFLFASSKERRESWKMRLARRFLPSSNSISSRMRYREELLPKKGFSQLN